MSAVRVPVIDLPAQLGVPIVYAPEIGGLVPGGVSRVISGLAMFMLLVMLVDYFQRLWSLGRLG
ncbi:hypothetical protein [Vulcanisaeta sp. JCM 16161]|uniref:hypothetical protein n=1 Tax=Vulcanisaeta sp. JCM 16161 TaxID=1295372 RepID=UPI000A646BC5|nr:hypothetical protein [Vulcanisaeta sp. JCM 16161]